MQRIEIDTSTLDETEALTIPDVCTIVRVEHEVNIDTTQMSEDELRFNYPGVSAFDVERDKNGNPVYYVDGKGQRRSKLLPAPFSRKYNFIVASKRGGVVYVETLADVNRLLRTHDLVVTENDAGKLSYYKDTQNERYQQRLRLNVPVGFSRLQMSE